MLVRDGGIRVLKHHGTRLNRGCSPQEEVWSQVGRVGDKSTGTLHNVSASHASALVPAHLQHLGKFRCQMNLRHQPPRLMPNWLSFSNQVKPLARRGPKRSNNHELNPHKGKAMVAISLGILKAGESTSRTRPNPATGSLGVFNSTSKAVGCGAERLAAPIAQGVYH